MADLEKLARALAGIDGFEKQDGWWVDDQHVIGIETSDKLLRGVLDGLSTGEPGKETTGIFAMDAPYEAILGTPWMRDAIDIIDALGIDEFTIAVDGKKKLVKLAADGITIYMAQREVVPEPEPTLDELAEEGD